MTEMVTDGRNGYVFAQGSKDDLAKQLVRALKDDEGRKQLAEHALEYIQANHDWTQIGEKTARVYRNVLGLPADD
jgi:glycosyltransferase involved in cell wall biosynthesis